MLTSLCRLLSFHVPGTFMRGDSITVSFSHMRSQWHKVVKTTQWCGEPWYTTIFSHLFLMVRAVPSGQEAHTSSPPLQLSVIHDKRKKKVLWVILGNYQRELAHPLCPFFFPSRFLLPPVGGEAHLRLWAPGLHPRNGRAEGWKEPGPCELWGRRVCAPALHRQSGDIHIRERNNTSIWGFLFFPQPIWSLTPKDQGGKTWELGPGALAVVTTAHAASPFSLPWWPSCGHRFLEGTVKNELWCCSSESQIYWGLVYVQKWVQESSGVFSQPSRETWKLCYFYLLLDTISCICFFCINVPNPEKAILPLKQRSWRVVCLNYQSGAVIN